MWMVKELLQQIVGNGKEPTFTEFERQWIRILRTIKISCMSTETAFKWKI